MINLYFLLKNYELLQLLKEISLNNDIILELGHSYFLAHMIWLFTGLVRKKIELIKKMFQINETSITPSIVATSVDHINHSLHWKLLLKKKTEKKLPT